MAVICNDTHDWPGLEVDAVTGSYNQTGVDKYQNIEIQVPIQTSCWLLNWIMDFTLICTRSLIIYVVDFDI